MTQSETTKIETLEKITCAAWFKVVEDIRNEYNEIYEEGKQTTRNIHRNIENEARKITLHDCLTSEEEERYKGIENDLKLIYETLKTSEDDNEIIKLTSIRQRLENDKKTIENKYINTLKDKREEAKKNYIDGTLREEYEAFKKFDFSTVEGRPIFSLWGMPSKHTVNQYKTYKDIENQYKFNDCDFMLSTRLRNIYAYERVVYDYVRPYFDIDIKPEEATENDLKTLIDLIYYILHDIETITKTNITAYGVIEYNKINYSKDFAPYNIETNLKGLFDFNGINRKIYIFENSEKGFTKSLSAHIYVSNVCFDSAVVKSYMENITNKYKNEKHIEVIKGFDTSVYNCSRGKQQMFRTPYSGKSDIDKHKRRPANVNILSKFFNEPDFKNEMIHNCVICPSNGDKIIPFEPQKSAATKATNTKATNTKATNTKATNTKATNTKATNTKATNTNSGLVVPRIEGFEHMLNYVKTDEEEEVKSLFDGDISIFKYLKKEGEIIDMYKYTEEEDPTHFEIAQYFAFYTDLPLSFEEFQTEICLINNQIDIERFLKELKAEYIQDYAKLWKLKYLKRIIFEKVNEYNEISNGRELEEDEKIELKIITYVYSKIQTYIDKYDRFDFVRHTFYNPADMARDDRGLLRTKRDKILYNCFKLVGYDTIYYYNGKEFETYDNKTQLRKAYKLNSMSVDGIYDSLITFKDIEEFELMRLEGTYKPEPIDDLLNMIRDTFENEDDYKYFISWLAYKITYKTTNGRGLINQSEKDAAENSLKTYSLSLIRPFLKVYNTDIKALNKSLSGTYMSGHMTVIEELPREIKELNTFINTIKEYSAIDRITIEEKGKNPITKKNQTDFVINTNFNVSAMFYNTADAKTLDKRFRILTRKTIDIKHYSKVLDKYGRKDGDYINRYKFYRYLFENTELINYYNEHMNESDQTAKKYIAASVSVDECDKIETSLTLEEFTKSFKSKFIDKYRRMRIGKFVEELKKNNIVKDAKQKTVRQTLIQCECLHYEGQNLHATDKEIENIYNKYYSYIHLRSESEEDSEATADII